MKTANLFIYLQALGGKFLGPNAYQNTNIKVAFRYSGGSFEIPYQVLPTTNDGMISPVFSNGNSTTAPILTPSAIAGENPSVNYLTTNINTIMGLSQPFKLPKGIELGVLSVSIPTPLGKPVCFEQSVWLLPEQGFYKITLTVPGLLVEPNISSPSGSISVYVKMMCGCKVSAGLPVSFWSPQDFMVNANVNYTDGTIAQYSLSFDTSSNDSLFVAQIANSSKIKSISFYAQQMSTNNYGTFEQIF